ncbi:NAD(P)/FAD-dependent oxidoreductase [Virgibacillus sp. MSP4-1]|uniref:NAD(P)/FAD-dependent oxidoreductase n=1 Tax=Virgibacillus sp. MSP4-1 TaxID=2700081 RepID=UPI00039A1BC8|nr:NAD(P)/FAD-dependent oxidoreductase [Virgibacillus sp. MSP4-1]QHS23651.1 NAD(P)/FAD-dependent oxidoreductase [Virgibacillus sp. MSP4-1]
MYDAIILGGGIAGLQAAIQLGRYKHNVLVIDSNHGRSTLCRSYHNILGYPDGVSGQYLREMGQQQARDLGVQFAADQIQAAHSEKNYFLLQSKEGGEYKGKLLLIATGVMDRFPPFEAIYPCLGKSIYVCPDCDGHEIQNKRTMVLGSGNPGANMALTLSYWTDDLIYVNHEHTDVDDEKRKQLEKQRISYYEMSITDVLADGNQFGGVKLNNGQEIKAEKGFIAFGGNEVRSDIGKQLGAERLENRHIMVNPRTKMTSVPNVWAAGDVVAHSEQVTIAMGEGSQAAIWMHKTLLKES